MRTHLSLSNTLTIGGSGTGAITLSGTVSGAGGLTLNQAANLTHTNTYTGLTTVNVPGLLSQSNNAFGGGGSLLLAGRTLNLNGFNQTSNDITFGTGGPTSGGSILGANSSLTLNGNITYNGLANGGGQQARFGMGSKSGDITLVLASGNHTVGLTSPPVFSPNDATTLFDCVISGSGGLTVSGFVTNAGNPIGANEVEFNQANTYTGATTVSGGAVLYLSTAQALGAGASAVTVGANSTLIAKSKTSFFTTYNDQGFGSLAGSGTVTFNTARLTIGANNTNTTFTGLLDGTTGGITKVGTGTLTLSGTSHYTGGTIIDGGGTLLIGANDALPTGSNVRVTNGALAVSTGITQTVGDVTFFGGPNSGTNNSVALGGAGSVVLNGNFLSDRATAPSTAAPSIRVQSGLVLSAGTHTVSETSNVFPPNYSYVFSGPISGSGGLNFTSSDLMFAAFTGTSTYTGTTQVGSNTFLVGGATNAFSASSAVTLNGGSLLLRAPATSDGIVSGSYSQTIGSLASGTASGGVDLGTATLTTGGDNTSTSFRGAFSGTTGSLIKAGAGVFTLASGGTASSYTGATTVRGGTLTVNSNLTSSSGVSVENNATLSGTGSVSAITLLTGGTLSPGNPTGTLSAASLLWNGGGVFRFEQGDLLALSGALTKGDNSGGGGYFFDFSSAALTNGSTFDLITFGSTTFQSGDFSYTGAPNGVGGNFALVGNTLRFTVSPVSANTPEPGSLLLMLFPAGLLLGRVAHVSWRSSRR